VTTYNSLVSRTDAAALIPEEVARDIIKGLPSASASLAQFSHVPMTRGQQRLPVLSVLPVAYWVDAAYQAGIVRQAYDAGNYVTEGTGVDFLDDINLTMGKVEADGYDVNAFWARKKVKAHLRGLRATTHEIIYQEATQGFPGTIYGEPLAFVANGPWVNNYELIAGDRSMAILGIRQDISFKIFTEGVVSDGAGAIVLNLMQQDAVAMRAVGRFGFAVANPINLENSTDATRFPFAVLVNAGS
jgi:hypothetical protein